MKKVEHFFDPATYTLTYVVYDPQTKDAVVIDPVLDYRPEDGHISDKSSLLYVDFIKKNQLNLKGILETHAHADHLSSSQVLKEIFPQAKVAIGEKIKLVQDFFKKHFNLDYIKTDASQFDMLFKDGQTSSWGSIQIKAISTPGHTPACMSYLIDDMVFTGDALFMPDYGTGRCDFPLGGADQLYDSITKNLFTLPDETKVYVGHDYGPNGREIKYLTTIGESKNNNIQLKATTKREDYISFRSKRDSTLSAPKLLLPSIQINIDAGHLPPKEPNGKSYIKIPLNPQLKTQQ